MSTATTIEFSGPGFVARELQRADVPLLQALFDATPGYFQAVNGRDAWPDEASREFDERPPPSMGFTRFWPLGFFDANGELVGVAIVVSDLMAATVWHLTLFLIITRRQGQGLAQSTYAALEAWMRERGARWMRLAVVVGNPRAERFWIRHGFRPLRVSRGVDTGGRHNDLRTMCKPLVDDADLERYLGLVPRDRGEPPRA